MEKALTACTDTLTLERDGAGELFAADNSELLLRTLDEQEARIRQLEEQLATLHHDDNRVIDQTALRAGAPVVRGRRYCADITPATRILVSEQDGRSITISLGGGATTIGREPANDIQIRSRFVSRAHARITGSAGGAVIEDLESRNGIYVNSRRVSHRRLRSGDYIRIGRVQLRYLDIMEDRGIAGRA